MKNIFIRLSVLTVLLFGFSCSSDNSPAETPIVAKTKVTIISYTVSYLPFTDPNGFLWDVTNGPDLSFCLFDGSTIVGYTNSTISNATESSLPISVALVTPYSTTNFYTTFTVVCADDDENDSPSTSNEIVGQVGFLMNDYTTGSNKYPSSVSKEVDGAIITLNLVWE